MWPSGVGSTFPGGSALGQNASPMRGPYQVLSTVPPGLVGKAMLPARQSSENQRRIIAADEALHPFADQLSMLPSLRPAMRVGPQRCGSHCGRLRTGGSIITSFPLTIAMGPAAFAGPYTMKGAEVMPPPETFAWRTVPGATPWGMV